jgi:hypothetical protein
MPFFSRGDDDQVDDYDEYDPTPYGGGYDIALTYGRPIPPSDETCYPISSASGEIDYDRPNYYSYSGHLLTLMKLLKLNTAAMLVPSPDLDPLLVNLNRHTVSSLQ